VDATVRTMSPEPPALPRPIAALAVVVVAATLIVACTQTVSSPTTLSMTSGPSALPSVAPATGSTAPSPTTAVASPTPVPTPTPVSQPSAEGQLLTAWGLAWDSIPPWFPLPDGARPTHARGEPASAEFETPLSAGTVGEVIDFYRIALEVGEYAYSVDGPLADGSYTIDGSDRGPCRFRLVVAPSGAHALLRVFYGVGCRLR
jgi:hypothetical protein